MKENNMMSYEMYEELKETMIKTIKVELSTKNHQPTDNDLPQQIEQIVRSEQEQHRAIITQLAGRLEGIEQNYANVGRRNRNSCRTSAKNNTTPSRFQF